MTQAATLAQLASSGALSADTSGNVGIGTTTPRSISGYTSLGIKGTTGALFDLYDNSNRLAAFGVDSGGANIGSITSIPLSFTTNNVERARIDTSGNLLVGTTTASGKFTVSGNAGASRVAAVLSDTAGDAGSGALLVSKFTNTTTTSQVFVAFAVNNNTVGNGQINANGASAAAFGSYSDRRLKENIADLPSQLDNIMALRPVEFDYIESEGGGHQIGFIAQEVQTVYPDLVGEREDGMFTLTDLNKNDARLIKAIQELKAELDVCKAEIAALKGV